MRKEIVTACFLLLLLAAAFVNTHFLNKLTGDVVALVEAAEKSALEDKWDEAEKKAEKASELWTGSDTYTHLVLRHNEIEAATDLLYGFLEQVYAKEEGAVKGAAQAAVARLESISSIEKVRFGSVF
jgi:hypothetical protein